jgi:hypothetical protein
VKLGVAVASLVPRLFRIFPTITGTLTLLAGLRGTAALLLTRFLARRLVLLAGLVLIRHVVSFHGNTGNNSPDYRPFLRKKSRITTIRHYSGIVKTYLRLPYRNSQYNSYLSQ